MTIKEAIQPYIRGQKRVYALLGLIGAFVLILSLSTLTTKPRMWTDEAVSIELAKSFVHTGALDIEVAPQIFTGFPELLQSTGYPVTVPLGILFSLLGESFTLARLFMVAWMLGTLYVVFRFARTGFNSELAVLSVLLIATFASFHNSGRTVVGEIPGFALLLAGIYFAFEKRSFAWAGLFLGFCVVTKPSVFLLVLPAFALVLLHEPRAWVRRVFSVGVGMLPAALLWLALVPGFASHSPFIVTLVEFFQNPYSSDISENINRNLSGFFGSTTLLYFSLLALILFVARFWVRRKETLWAYDFTLVYSVLAYFYFLRSPGWLRYLLIAELLILVLLPHAVFTLLHVLQRRVKRFRALPLASVSTGFVLLLAGVQMIQLLTVADIFTSDSSIRAAQEINTKYREERVLVLGDMTLYTLLHIPHKEVVIDMTGMPVVGKNTLLGDALPDIVVTGHNRFRVEAEEILLRNYASAPTLYGYDIFKRIDE